MNPNGITDFSKMFESIPSLMSNVPDSSSDTLTAEGFRKMLEDMQMDIPSPYEMAEKEMDKQLSEKGLPNMKVILEKLEQTNPEYFL